ncbi:MAG: 4-hydroxy-tetrahydrodipicolinate synthase [Chloroflexota bacterium]
MDIKNLRGTVTAIVTPFKADLSIDFDAFKKLLDFQIEGGVEAVVVAGSTGEAATLTAKERMSLIIAAVGHVAGKIPIIAGTGTNDTTASVSLSILAKEAGASALLLVAPYYNKPSQEGLFQHFLTISDEVDLPQIIYNVPGRTGVNITAETQLKIAEQCHRVFATKEASGDLEQMMEIMKYAPEGFSLFCGDDSLTIPAVLMGAAGIISVLSNYAPRRFSDCVRAALAGDYKRAVDASYELLDLMQLNFVETNPVPVKTALAMMGMCEEYFRLPLLPMQTSNSHALREALEKAGII